MSWVLLAVPFLIAIAALGGLTASLPMFHGSDELVYHYPTILRFSAQLPFPHLGDYRAAQTPLFHLVMAYAGQVSGYELWRLRLLEALISYGLGLAVRRLLRRRMGLEDPAALALSVLFVLSPYVFAASFRLMTDNLALLFSVLALDALESFRQSSRVRPFLLACLFAGAALLTRQSTAFLFAVAGLYALFAARVPTRTRALALAGLAVSAVPAGLLFLAWHGLTPPAGDTSSCGLCAGGGGAGAEGLRMLAPELTLAVIGLYGSVLFAFTLPWRAAARRRRVPRGALIAAVAGAVMLLLFPMHPAAHRSGVVETAGLLWTIARHTPRVLDTSLLFWALAPLSGAVLWWRLGVAHRRWPAVVLLGCFLLGALSIRLAWQKYVDPFALLVLLLTVRPGELASSRRLSGAGVLAAGYVAYLLSFL